MRSGNGKYPMVFAPKSVLWRKTRQDREDSELSYEHMPAEMPPKMSVSSFADFLKGKSGLLIYERLSNILQQRILEQGGLSAEKNACKIAGCIQNQLKEDALSDQLTSDLFTSFTGIK